MGEIKNNLAADLLAADMLESKIAKLKEDELEVRAFKIEAQKERIAESQKNIELAKNADFGILSDEAVLKLIKDSEQYIDAAKNSMSFIDKKTFLGVVPLFRKNLILVGGRTGEGKSTAMANIACELISQLDPKTGKARRILMITNEEKAEDFYNRITCLIIGIAYVNHDKFTEEQKLIFSKYIPLLSRLITVVDDNHGGGTGMTTTFEGIDTILSNCLRDGHLYDAVLIDYYQNISSSQKDPSLDIYKCQAKLATILDKHKNIYPAPIVLMAQIKPAEAGKEEDTPFEHRIKGAKQIMVPATFVMEMVPVRSELITKWVIHKGRFSEGVGTTLVTGFDKGRFITYDDDFKAMRLALIEKKSKDKMLKSTNGANNNDSNKKEDLKNE